MPREISVQVRITCPRLYAEEGKSHIIPIERCIVCQYHKGIQNVSDTETYVICDYPSRYDSSRRKKKYEAW